MAYNYETISSRPAKRFAEEQGCKIMLGQTTGGKTMFICGGIIGSVANSFDPKKDKIVNEVRKTDTETGESVTFFMLQNPFALDNQKELEL